MELAGILLAALLCPAHQPRAQSQLYKLVRIQAAGSKRFAEADIIRASGLNLGRDTSLADLQRASSKLAGSGVFTAVKYRYTTSGPEITVELDVEDESKFLPCVFTNFIWFDDAELLSQPLEKLLNDRYQGKVLTLRQFRSGGRLTFDAQGNLLRGGPVGPWTLDGVVKVIRLKVRDGRVEVEAKREDLLYDEKDGAFRYSPAGVVWIEAGLSDHAPSLTSVQSVLAQIFLAPGENLADVAPAYWKPFLEGKVTWPLKDPHGLPGTLDFRQPGLTPPWPLREPEPPYTSEARSAEVQGTVVLSLMIGKAGDVQDVVVVKPLGMGLDDTAAEAVSHWKFRPATRNGVPVSTRVRVEVKFRLY